MKDLYSFHANQEDLDVYYVKMAKVYMDVYKKMGLGKFTYRTFASGGSFSKYSDEFQTITEAGEDIIYICRKCNLAINKEIKQETAECPNCKNNEFEEKKAVEVGNIFKLGTKYSDPFDLKFRDKDGQEKPVIMGCFGMGLGRMLGAIVETNHDEKGIIWPESVAPFKVHLIAVENDKKIKAEAEKIYKSLQKENIEVLFDNREKNPGEKFAEADLMGIPYRVVVSKRTLEKKSIELKKRSEQKAKLIPIKNILKVLK